MAEETGTKTGAVVVVTLGQAGGALVAFCAGRPVGSAVEAAALARACAALPVLGAIFGWMAAYAGDWVGQRSTREIGAVVTLLLLMISSGGRFLRDLGGVVGHATGSPAFARLVPALVFAAEGIAIVELPDGLRTVAVVLAALLGRWAFVVQGYGSLVASGDANTAALVRGLEFREFGLASVSAMALTLAVSAPLGLLALMLVAALAIGFRIAVHRWQGGVSLETLGAGAAVGELTPLLFLVALAYLLGAS